MTNIHPTALVDPSARLGEGVSIGPFCTVGPGVSFGHGVTLHSHVVVVGETSIDAGTTIFPFASIGHRPQDLKFRGESSTLTIGTDCTIREGVTINPGTATGDGATRVGHRCTLLAQAHVGHDCRLGDDIVLSNNVMLGGHVVIGDGAILGGGAAVHQFVRVGRMAFVGGLTGLEGDLVPFGMAIGDRARLAGLNLVGLRRQGVPRESIKALGHALATIFADDGTLDMRLEMARPSVDDAHVEELLSFLRARGRRPLCRPAA